MSWRARIQEGRAPFKVSLALAMHTCSPTPSSSSSGCPFLVNQRGRRSFLPPQKAVRARTAAATDKAAVASVAPVGAPGVGTGTVVGSGVGCGAGSVVMTKAVTVISTLKSSAPDLILPPVLAVEVKLCVNAVFCPGVRPVISKSANLAPLVLD